MSGAPPPVRWASRWRLLRRRLQGGWQRAEFFLARRFGLASREDRAFFALIPAVGVLAGILGVLVHRLIDSFHYLLWGGHQGYATLVARRPPWAVIGVLVIGGALVGALTWFGRQALSGQGMSVLIEAVALRGGRIEPRPVILRGLAAVATVGAGGSLGREGPMIRLGAMIASRLGLHWGLSAHRIKVLVGCGAAAGLAAAYNVPIGGTLFAMEVVLGNFALEIFGPIVISSVISTLIARGLEGNVPLYWAPRFELVSGWELLLYAGLGLVGALTSIVFVHAVRLGALGFGKLRLLPEPIRPVLGMALVGVLGLFLPQVLGSGLETISTALHGGEGLPWRLLLLLPLAKLLATALTAGSGCSGGLFTPGLFLGGVVGAGYGEAMGVLFPGMTAGPGAYAAVGMAAVAAGTSHAPISAILILFEFTGNYQLILPLMVAAILSSLTARGLYRYSIYTEALDRRGVDFALRMEEVVLAGLETRDLLREDRDVLAPEMPHRAVLDRFLETRHERLFVVGADSRLLGAVSLHDVKHTFEGGGEERSAAQWMRPVAEAVRDSDRLHRVAVAFAQSDFERLPVVDEHGRFRGVLAKRDLLSVYAQEVLGRPAMLAQFVAPKTQGGRRFVEVPADHAVRRMRLPPSWAGRTLAELDLPGRFGVRVLEVERHQRREVERLLPQASTLLLSGDEVLLLGPARALDDLAAGGLGDGIAPSPEVSSGSLRERDV